MVKSSSIVIAVMLGLFGTAPAAAEPTRVAPKLAADIVPPHEVFTIIRSIGLRPLGHPHYRGRFYVVYAVDRYGEDVRVVVDARAAQVVSVRPLDRLASRDFRDDEIPPPPPRYEPGPRLLEPKPRYLPPRPVPQPDARYNALPAWPQDDEPEADEFDGDDWNETGSLQPRDPPRIEAPKMSPPLTRATRSAAATLPKAPLPRPRPALPTGKTASASDAQAPTSSVTASATTQRGLAADAPVAASDVANAAASNAAKTADANAETGKSESKNETAKSEATPSEKSKSDIRIIEIKKPEPRI
jgi:hypothetical protein